MSYPTLLTDKCILVTGGTRGLGLAMCKAFAQCGARVAMTYARDDDDARDAADLISDLGQSPLVFKGCVSDVDHARDCVRAVVDEWGGIDVLVNNAAITDILPIALIEEDEFDRVLEINVKGPYLFSRAALRYMIRAKSGHILNIGSFASERFVESPVHYAASKSALRGMTEALALEVGRHNVKVNMIAPGLLDSGLGTMVPQHRLNEFLSQSALGRLGNADEVATLAAFMVSDDNTFMTGAKIVADGGL